MKKTTLALLLASMTLAGCNFTDDLLGNDKDNTPPEEVITSEVDDRLYAMERSEQQQQSINAWYEAGTTTLNQALSVYASPSQQQANALYYQPTDPVSDKIQQATLNTQTAKNIILFVGDGMGISTVTAARILDGQNKGKTGEENQLSFEKFPFSGLAKTYNTDKQTPDSAGTMTAMMTGVKTRAGMINVTGDAFRGDCASTQGNTLISALTLAELAGKATGIVSTARITHATPAATYSHSPERGWEANKYLPDEAVAAGCKDIAQQLIDYPYGDGIEVVLGGGKRSFITAEHGGKRTDGQDLTAVWKNMADPAGRTYVNDRDELLAVDPNNTGKLMGLFTSSHMSYESAREENEPSLTEMTTKAIDMLAKDEDGFFLTVESGRIDHGHHGGNAHRALTDAIEFDHAIAAAIKHNKINLDETLIIVTADHSHVFTIAGYPTRGNPILGKVVGNDHQGKAKNTPTLALDGKPYTTVSYTNGYGAYVKGVDLDIDEHGRADLTNIDTTGVGFYQEALIPTGSETHAGEDVGIYAVGPWSHLVQGTNEQNVIFHIMNKAANLVEQAEANSQAL